MKRIIKNSIAVLLCAVMLFGSAPLSGFKSINLSGTFKKIAGWLESMKLSTSASALSSSGQCGTNVYWTFDEDTGTLTISGEGELFGYDYGTLPFYNIPMKKVIINDGITKIGGHAFYNCCLTSVTIPDSVVGIDYYAFMNCRSLTNITIPDSVEYISVYAFANCTSLTSIIIPNNVQSISVDVFNGCKQLKNVTLGNGITVIDSRTFANCVSLTNIFIPDSVTEIFEAAFANCSNLTNIILPDSVRAISKNAFNGCTSLNKITIPNKVLKINYATFANCSSLESVTFTGSVRTIDIGAFAYCHSLKNITIPSSVTSIGNLAFYQCRSLSEIVIPDNVTSIGDNVFTWCESLTNVIIGKSISAIGYQAFACCGLTSIYIPENVKTIGQGAFCRCDKLNNITLADGIISIADNAFDSCTSLKDIIIPESVQSVGACVFFSCAELSSVVFLGFSTNIGSAAFYKCSKLKNVSLPEDLIQIKDYTFYQCCALEVIEIPDSVTSIEKNAFAECGSLTSIIIPKNVDNIGEYVFLNCNALKSITVDVNNTTFDSRNNCNAIIISESDKLFVGCNNSTIPNTVKSIGNCAFLFCTRMTEVNIPESVQTIEMQAFSYCLNITDITIPKSVYSIGPGAFGGCESLTNITVDINNPIFDSRENSNSIIMSNNNELICGCKNSFIPQTVKSIGPGAFFHCSELQQITIPNGVTDIGEYAFYNCTGLITLSVPNSVINIGYGAFANVNNITYSQNWYDTTMNSVGSPWGAKAVDAYIEGDLYYYDSSKELLLGCSTEVSGTVNIPDSVEEVGENCFSGCENIEAINFHNPVYFADSAVSGCKNLQTLSAPYNSDGDIVYTKPVDDVFSTASISGNEIFSDYDTGILFCQKNANGKYEVPQSVTYICDSAFANCINVFVSIPDGVNLKRIGANAFLNSGNYNDSSNWSNGVLVIGNYIVASQKYISGDFKLSDNIKGIADKAFRQCSAMTGFSFGTNSKLKFLGREAFSECSSEIKNSIHFPQSLRYVGENIFGSDIEDEARETLYIDSVLVSVASDVQSFVIDEGTTQIAAGAFLNCNNLTEIVIPDTVKIIDKNTFKGCPNLKSITFEGNIIEIGDNAFENCVSLTEINIPASVEEIGNLAFYGCTGMKEFKVADGNKNYKSAGGVLMSADGKAIIQYPSAKDGTKYVIADNTYVYDLAFYRSRKLQKIFVGNGVKYGNRNPFASCTAVFNFGGDDTEILFDNKMRTIKSVSASCSGEFTVPDFVAEIGDDAFRDCTGITNVSFSKAENLNGIGDYAFYGCTGLTKIVIPSSVKEIGRSAFKNCFNLKTVEFEYDESDCVSNLKVIGDYAFCNCQCNASDEKWYEAYFESGAEKYPIIGEYAFSNFENFEIFKNPFCNSAETDNQGFVYGLKPGLESIDAYINDGNGSISSYCNTNIIGTGSVITVKNNLDESEKNDSEMSYIAVVFGDANGDGWYDGTDAVIVSCIANGLLTREQVGGAVYMASDCNHDGVIDQLDVDILQQAGVLLAEVDQSKSPKELLETSSDYVEYLSMINQEIDKPVDNIPAKEPIQNSPKTLFVFIIEIINAIFKLFIMNIR